MIQQRDIGLGRRQGSGLRESVVLRPRWRSLLGSKILVLAGDWKMVGFEDGFDFCVTNFMVEA